MLLTYLFIVFFWLEWSLSEVKNFGDFLKLLFSAVSPAPSVGLAQSRHSLNQVQDDIESILEKSDNVIFV